MNYIGFVAAPGEKVYLYDTSYAAPIDSTTSASNGNYSITATPLSGHAYQVQCNRCNPITTYYLGSFSSNVTIANMVLSCATILVRDTVRNSTTGAPVWGQKLYMKNNTLSYVDSNYTNVSGVASFNIPVFYTSSQLSVSTNACGLQGQQFTFTAATKAAPTLNICLSNPVISGTLTNLSANGPIAGHKVYLIDSSVTGPIWLDSGYTNASGAYSFTLPVSLSAGTMVVYAYTCGARARNSAAFNGGSLTLNLSGCATSSATISGTVINTATSAAIAGQKVYLTDSITLSNIYRDSTVTASNGGYSFTVPPSITSGYLSVSTLSCGYTGYNSIFYTGSSAVANFSVSPTPGTISGTVHYYSGGPVAGASVQLTKSGFAPISTTANSQGAYSTIIPCSWGAGAIAIDVSAPAQNCNRYNSIFYTGANVAGLADSLCYFSASGVVSKQGGGVASNAKVYWVNEQLDSTTTPVTITLNAIDSTVTNASGVYKLAADYMPSGPYNINYIKAALQPSDPAYSNFLPTYHDSALVWSSADSVKYSQWQSRATNVHISLRGGVNPGGPGFIGGNVLLGANKAAGVGDPLPGRILLLTTAAGKAVAYTYSDAAGKFSFSNLPLGSYLLFGDAGGKKNPALAITLTQGKATVSDVVFEENDKKFEGHLGTTGVYEQTALEGLSLYPNPVRDFVAVSGLGRIGGAKTAVLRNATGAVAGSFTIAAGVESIPAKGWPAGLYLLQIQTAEGVVNFRLIKE